MESSKVPRTAAWKAGRKAGLKAGIRIRKPKKATAAFAKKVLAVTARTKETKYAAEQIVRGNTDPASVVTQAATVPGSFYRLLTRVTQGVGEHQRIGDRIQPTRATATFTFNWGNAANNQDVVVNLWLVRIKGAQSPASAGATPANTFLKVGDGTNVDPNNGDQPLMLQQINHYPLNTDQFTNLKHYTFRMRKGVGNQANNGAAGAIGPTGVPAKEDFRVIKYSWKPPALDYDTNPDTLPTNHYPVALVWAQNADGSAYGNTLYFSLRTELFFKDA